MKGVKSQKARALRRMGNRNAADIIADMQSAEANVTNQYSGEYEYFKLWQDLIPEMEKDLVENGRIKEVSADVWKQYPQEAIACFMNKYAIYCAPTTELLDTLDELIGDKDTIEVCAGMGYLGQGLNLDHITDACYQVKGIYRKAIEDRGGVPTIPPPFVEPMTANHAAVKYRPHTILVSYGTHKDTDIYGSGSEVGVDYKALKYHCKRIIFIGNLLTHKDNPMTANPSMSCEGLITRTMPELSRIFIWEK